MVKPKPNEQGGLRTPKAKKLGLVVPTALRLPHEDLIGPDRSVEKPSPTPVPEYRSTEPSKSKLLEEEDFNQHPSHLLTEVPKYRSTPVPQQSEVIPTSNFYRKANEVADELDRELTPAESKVFEHLIRLSVGFNKDRCQVRISALQKRTGYRSDKTVRAAINGLIVKGRIARLTHHNNPLGDEYQILNYSGNTGVPKYRSTAAENTPVLESKVTGELNTKLKEKDFDDEPAALLLRVLQDAEREVAGKTGDLTRWFDVLNIIIAELKVAASRSSVVSSAPAFLAEHLRRRLGRAERQSSDQQNPQVTSEAPVSSRKREFTDEPCSACKGSLMEIMPNGEKKRCGHCRDEVNYPTGREPKEG
jgi:hypothetical protein